jgi:DNA-binding MarR family transcriptional regulator
MPPRLTGVLAETAEGRPAEAADARRVAAFRSLLRSYLRTSERVARASGLTPQRYLLLLMIKGSPDGSECATVSELVERLELAQSTVTELVKRAEAAGLVEREWSAGDGRVAHLRLTAEAERRFSRAFHAHDDERRRLRELVGSLERPRLSART